MAIAWDNVTVVKIDFYLDWPDRTVELGPDRGTGTGPDRTDFSAVRSQSKRLDRETVSIFGPDWTETFITQAFINKLSYKLNR